ncbi:tyrosine-type recombinase/integrase [Thomasclavelia cocleata]|uniref:tyrosine-type recombinase/integrase n=1 Tax=Thomasclavelia cocleata TaxID=69824 RepID=UPI00272E338F|nr:tyrosine-type recombinase/integrase [Thomasclavelia cocleata]
MLGSESFRNEVLLKLKVNFSNEQLMMIDDALISILVSYNIKKSETSLSTYVDFFYSKEVDEFLMNKEFTGKSKKTINAYRGLLNQFVTYIQKDIKLSTDNDIMMFLQSYQKQTGISNHTKENRRLILSSFFGWLHKRGRIPINPIVGVDPIKYTQKEKIPLSEFEIEQIRYSCTSEYENALFETLLSTGCRISEVVNMDINDINFTTGEIKVLGKGNKERIVELSTRAMFRINIYLKERNDDNEALFVSKTGKHKRLGKNTLEKTIKQLGKKSGLKRDIHPHLLRHTFACQKLDETHDIYKVSQLMGHAKCETTMIYLHGTTSTKKIKNMKIA